VREAGIPFVIVTGRMFRSVKRYLDELGLDGLVVCYQGAVVADASGRFLRHVPIPLELAREAIDAVAGRYHLNCYVGDELYVAEVTEEARAYADFQDLPIHPVGDLRSWLTEPPTKLVAVGEPIELDALELELKAHFGDRLYISKSLPHFLELASPTISKGSGLGFVAEHLGFTAPQTVAFGDGENDLELLEWAAFGIAVENAHERLLAIADATCPPAEAEGVAGVIEAYLASRDAG
jgi:Cof subfamily protein (haloacid dehalogenase superfamily)